MAKERSSNTGKTSPAEQEKRRAPDLANTIGALMDRHGDQIRRALPKFVDPERFMRICLTTLRYGSDALQKSTPESVMATIMEASADGLDLDGVDAAMVPYWNSSLGTYEAQYQPMYQGLLKLARRSKEIRAIHMFEVYKGDEFNVRLGTKPEIFHAPTWGDHDAADLTHAYVVFDLAGGGQQFEIMTVSEMNKIRDRSRSYQKKQGPWITDPIMMYRKTVLRRGLKYAPTDDHAKAALSRDEAREVFAQTGTVIDVPSAAIVPRAATPKNAALDLFQEVVDYMRNQGEGDPRGAAAKLLGPAVPKESIADWTLEDVEAGRREFEMVRSGKKTAAKKAKAAPVPAKTEEAPPAEEATPNDPPADVEPPADEPAPEGQPSLPFGDGEQPPQAEYAPKRQVEKAVKAMRTWCSDVGITDPPGQDAAIVHYWRQLGCDDLDHIPLEKFDRVRNAKDRETVFKAIVEEWAENASQGKEGK